MAPSISVLPLEPLHAETPRVAQVLLVKKVTRRDKEHRHVEQVDERHEQCRTLGMPGTHQDNRYRLADRQCSIISFHLEQLYKVY